jgi:hypothetical protein
MMSREEVLKLLGQEREPDRAQQSFESHLARAKWMARTGTCFDAAGRTLMVITAYSLMAARIGRQMIQISKEETGSWRTDDMT